MHKYVLQFVVAMPLIVGALTASLAAQGTVGAQAATARPKPKLTHPPFRIIGNIYYVGMSSPTSYLIVTPEGSIVINAPELFSAKRNPPTLAGITALGFRVEDVRVLLNTHEHNDHSGELITLKKRSGGRLMVSEPTRRLLEQQSPGIVDRVIQHGDTVSLGGVTLTAHLTPGHTEGSTTWTMTVIERGKPYQVVFAASTSFVFDSNSQVDIGAFERTTFARFRALKPDVYLCDHMDMCDMAKKYEMLAADTTVNPFVDPAAWSAYIADLKQQIASTKTGAAKTRKPE